MTRAISEWRRLPSTEFPCLDQALRQQGASVDALANRGVLPSDPRLAQLRSNCRNQIVQRPQPSFNCTQARSPDEVAICDSTRLSVLDQEMASLFSKQLAGLGERQQQLVRTEQQGWLRERMSCGDDADCLDESYEKCLGQLRSKLGGSEPLVSQPEPGARSPSIYVVDGLALGGQVRFESEAYKQYHCTQSDKFPGFTWCHKETTEKTKRGEIVSSNSILRSPNGTAVYVNRYIGGAFFGQNSPRSMTGTTMPKKTSASWRPWRPALWRWSRSPG
jgi:uncharacterized protein YecT (DUF1311 family)